MGRFDDQESQLQGLQDPRALFQRTRYLPVCQARRSGSLALGRTGKSRFVPTYESLEIKPLYIAPSYPKLEPARPKSTKRLAMANLGIKRLRRPEGRLVRM